MQWFKLYGAEFLADIKIQQLTATERSCLITLFCLASMSSTKDGRITNVTEDALKLQSGVDPTSEEWDKRSVLETLAKFGLIKYDSDCNVTVTNWAKRQSFSESYERVRAHRERQRSAQQSQKLIPLQNVTPVTRIDKNRIYKKGSNEPAGSELSNPDALKKIEEVRAALTKKLRS